MAALKVCRVTPWNRLVPKLAGLSIVLADCARTCPRYRMTRYIARVSRVIMDDCPAQAPIAFCRAAPEMRAAGVPSANASACAARRWPLVALLLTASFFFSGCMSLREWYHNGFKVGPNYRKPSNRSEPRRGPLLQEVRGRNRERNRLRCHQESVAVCPSRCTN